MVTSASRQITNECFEEAARNCAITMDEEQRRIVLAPPHELLHVVAGPGSGKTRVLALRVLKLIFVDAIRPHEIMATTFTRRAANELRSRIQDWGLHLWEQLGTEGTALPDIGSIRLGTLDSLVQEALRTIGREYRNLVVIEDYALRLLLQRNPQLRADTIEKIQEVAWLIQSPFRDAHKALLEFRSRVYQYLVNRDKLSDQARRAIELVDQLLHKHHIVDHDLINWQFYCLLCNDKITDDLRKLRYLLVDEYQDTNPLQEAIYLEIGRRCVVNGGGMLVVGDDDQALYRFRGATVEVFERFPEATECRFGKRAQSYCLSTNYRSRQPIVAFANQFIQLDDGYKEARVTGKPPIRANRAEHLPPVLTLSAGEKSALAEQVAELVARLHNPGLSLNGQPLRIDQLGEIAILTYSPRELSTNGRPRFPWHLRQALERRGIPVYNPRGQPLHTIEPVAALCGLLLHVIDPDNQLVQQSVKAQDVLKILQQWRRQASQRIEQDHNLRQALQQLARPRANSVHQELPTIRIVYQLLRWVPELVQTVDGLTYLELVTRAVTQAAAVSPWAGKFAPSEESSKREILFGVLVPIARGWLDLDEELLETLPGDRVNILSIHQSKGLEFPVVIVDLDTGPWGFPNDGKEEHRLEDQLGPHSALGELPRPGRDRAFDDLIRRYYVAFTRAKELLVLLPGRQKSVPNGWTRDGRCHASTLFKDVLNWSGQ